MRPFSVHGHLLRAETLAAGIAVLLAGSCADRNLERDQGPVWPDGLLRDAARDLAGAEQGSDSPGADATPDRSDSMGPATWKPVTSPVTTDLYAAACASGHVLVVGAGGTVLHRGSPVGGFLQQTISTASDLYAVTALTKSTGGSYSAVGGKDYQLWDSTDWGSTWNVAPQCSAFIFDTFYALHLTSETQGLGAGVATAGQGGGMKYYTGASWVCASPTHAGEVFYDVFALGTDGWVVGKTGGKVHLTEDGGLTWNPVTLPVTQTLRGVYFAAATLGVAVGDKGTIVRSTDGKGKTWTQVSSPTTQTLYDVFFWDAGKGWAVGEQGTVLHTTDGGKTWSLQASGSTARLEGVCFLSATEGWAVGSAGTILHTTTGGL